MTDTQKSADKPKVVVAGAGLAGLAAAYELTKTGKYQVTVLESRDRVGGRVHSVAVGDKYVDVGGFIVYPWYHEYWRLTRALGIGNDFVPIGKTKIFYRLEAKGPLYLEDNMPASWREKFLLGLRLISDWIQTKPNFRKPALDQYGSQTIAETIRPVVGENSSLEKLINVINEGYCYAPADQYQMSFFQPIMYQVTVHGDLRRGFYLGGNNQRFAETLAEAVRKQGGEIRLNEEVRTIRAREVVTNQATYAADYIVNALPATRDWNEAGKQIPYTHFYAMVGCFDKAPKVNGTPDWSAVFTAIQPKQSGITSVIRAAAMVPGLPPECIIINYKAGEASVPAEELERSLREQLVELFPGCQWQKSQHIVDWKQAMPIADAVFVQSIRDRQGRENIWYAGDYLGGPSMETAVSSGVSAAQAIITAP